MRFARILTCALAMLPGAAMSQPIAVAPFRSVELHNGGEVVVRHGESQRVETISGKPRISVGANGRLVIDNRDSPHQPRAMITVTTPALAAVSVDDGGKLIVEGFPRQQAVTARVANGGMLDLRRLVVDQVSATVNEGGIILVRPAERLDASISQGGNVTYWGDAAVKTSVQGGGAVSRGRPEDMEKPL